MQWARRRAAGRTRRARGPGAVRGSGVNAWRGWRHSASLVEDKVLLSEHLQRRSDEPRTPRDLPVDEALLRGVTDVLEVVDYLEMSREQVSVN